MTSPITTAPWSMEMERAAMVEALGADWAGLRGARLFVTGGTGFIGRWMLEGLLAADAAHGLAVQVTVLSRDPTAFHAAAPHIAGHSAIRLVQGDVTSLGDLSGSFTHIIHAATDASAQLTASDPLRMFDTIVTGTRQVLDMACAHPGVKLLFLSSGAVYGAQPPEISHLGEDWTGAPDTADFRSAYGEGKRAAELLCALYRRQHGLDIRTGRIFAALGPLLPLDAHFAAGNFIADALAGRTITVQGSGSAVRSYLYAADLAVWLWAMLLRAPDGAVCNLGSEHAVSIADLARTTAKVLGGTVAILGKDDAGWNPGRYIPSTRHIRDLTGVRETVGLEDAIARTAISYGWTQ